MPSNQTPIPTEEALIGAWNDVFQVASEVPDQLISADSDSVMLGVFEDVDPQSGRKLTVSYDEYGKPVTLELSFLIGAPVRRAGKLRGGVMRHLILDQDGLEIKYTGGHDARLLVREGDAVQFGEGIGPQRKMQTLGYLSIIGESIRDSLDRSVVEV